MNFLFFIFSLLRHRNEIFGLQPTWEQIGYWFITRRLKKLAARKNYTVIEKLMPRWTLKLV